MMRTKVGLYIHIPFCIKKCNYCDFCSYPNLNLDIRSRYIEKLCQEIGIYGDKNIEVDTIFFGGGTPTLLSTEEFEHIVNQIRKNFIVSADVEFTLEANPGTTNFQKMIDFARIGVNRFSIGLQTIHKNELKKLGRIHDFEEFNQTYNDLRKIGITNINIDLMYGIPHQTLDTFEKTLDQVLNLGPEHLSVYGLILEEGTPFYIERDTLDIPDEDIECNMYNLAARKLKEAGYIHYEISNYAKEGKESKHNLKYWHCDEYIGIGVSAHSYFDGRRYSNSGDIFDYIANPIQISTSEKSDIEEQKYEFIMLALRLKEGFSLSKYKFRFNEDFMSGREELINEMILMGYVSLDGDILSLTEKGFYVSNSILAELL